VRDTIEPLAIDLAGRGLATWNVEYRRVGRRHGGWSETSRDVASALAALRPLEESLDLSRIVVIGHSAGAQLAGWAAARRDVDGSEAAVRPAALVLLAGVMDLAECARRALGDTGNAAVSLMGGDPTELGDAYRQASPSANLPLGVPQIVVQGRRDSPDLTDMAREYVRAARAAGDEVVYHESAEADHFTVITPSSDEWHWTVGEIRRFLDC
jgi:acetyl esterase/lipase